jgi:S1-C subfamily serine protease
VVADRPGIVKISGSNRACGSKTTDIEGSGFVVGPEHVLTNAHVVAGVTGRPDVITESGRDYRGQIVLYDATRDVAILYVPGPRAPSGGPLLASDGRVYGVVFAQSTSQTRTGYALTASEVEGDVQTGEPAVRPVRVPASSAC